MTLPEPLRCPEFEGNTTSHTVDGMQMDVCNCCGGVWLGANQLKKVVAEGAAALDELLGFEPKGPRAAPRHSTLMCPQCRMALHRNLLAHSPDVQVDTCYGCGGLYLSPDGLAKLDKAAHAVPAGPAPVSPEVQRAGHALDTMMQDDQRRRAMLMGNYVSGCLGTNPYFRIAGV